MSDALQLVYSEASMLKAMEELGAPNSPPTTGEMVFGRNAQKGAAVFQLNLQWTRLRTGTWNVFSFTVEKRLELVGEAFKYRFDILEISSTKLWVDLPEGWKLFCSGVDSAKFAQAKIPTSPPG